VEEKSVGGDPSYWGGGRQAGKDRLAEWIGSCAAVFSSFLRKGGAWADEETGQRPEGNKKKTQGHSVE